MKLITTEVQKAISKITEAVDNGDLNPLEAFVALKKVETIALGAKKLLLSQAIDEADKQPKNGTVPFVLYGKKLQVVNVGGRWNFKDIPVIQDAEKRLKGLQELAKNAQKTGVEVADTATGEIIGAAIPPVSTTTIKITETK